MDGRPSKADTPMLNADEGDGDHDVLGADLDDSGTDGRPGPQERSQDVRQADADRGDPDRQD